MTEATYGPVRFSFVRTADVQSLPQQDQYGVDQVWTTHTVTFESVVAAGDLGGPALPGELPADTLARVQHLLELPRRRFTYKVGGRVLYDVAADPALGARDLDASTGPTPKVHGIHAVTDATFRITWSVSFNLRGCKDVRQQFASCRWVQTHAIDERQYSTLRMTGRLVVTSAMLQGLQSIDDLRWVVVPPIPDDFVRTSSEWVVLADGLAADFTFVDEERYAIPPGGSTRLKGHFIRSTNNFGATYVLETLVHLTGKKETPKATLMGMAVSIALDKINRGGPQVKDGRVFIKDGVFVETFAENEVACTLRAQAGVTPAGDNSKVIQGAAAALGRGMVAPVIPPAVGIVATIKAVADQLSKPAEAPVPPPIPDPKRPPAVAGLNLEQFNGVLAGGSVPPQTTGQYVPAAGIAPELYGHLPRLRLLAAAFNDPCLAQSVLRAQKNPPTVASSSLNSGTVRPTPTDTAALASRNPSSPPDPRTAVVTVAAQLPARMLSRDMANYDSPGVWEEFACEMFHDYRTSKSVLPTTISGGVGRLVQTHTDTCDLVVTWTARKSGGKPTIPSWADSADGNLVCTDHPITTDELELGPDGETLAYVIGGQYRYSFLDATKAHVRNAVPPWLPLDPARDGQYPATDTIIQGTQTSTLRAQQR